MNVRSLSGAWAEHPTLREARKAQDNGAGAEPVRLGDLGGVAGVAPRTASRYDRAGAARTSYRAGAA